MASMADTATGLRQIRQSLNISQELLARRTRSVGIGTVRNAEFGKRVTHDTATQLFEAVNTLLVENGREPINFEDLGLNLY